MYKKLFLACSLAAYLPNAFADLPANSCTGTNLSELVNSCTVVADAPNTEGDNGIALHLANGLNPAVVADVQTGLKKLMVFVQGIGSEDVGVNNANTILPEFDALRAQGVSVLLVAPGESGLDSVQDNAAALIKTITMINNYRAAANGNSDIVVMGHSQGGIVSRYALAKMERDNVPHNSSMYISYDAPHSGAYLPQSVQHLLPLMKEYSTEIVDFANSLPLPLKVLKLDEKVRNIGEDGLAFFEKSSDDFFTTANKQLVLDHIEPSAAPLRATLMEELDGPNGLGYPQQTENVAITNGNTKLVKQAQTLDTNGALFSISVRAGTPTVYALMDATVYPTVSSTKVLESNFGASGTWPVKCPWFFPFSCSWNQHADANLPKSRNSGVVKELDRVSGGAIDIGQTLYLAGRFIEFQMDENGNIKRDANNQPLRNPQITSISYTGQNTVNPGAPETTAPNDFAFIPTASALGLDIDTPDTDLASLISSGATPFGSNVIAYGDATTPASNVYHFDIKLSNEVIAKVMSKF